jgi:crotonobetainyl-CoA:carnitine CoA-transferase CaiB-like acyl-CoA transferase
MAGPLNGVRVVDFTWVVAGPVCTKVLGDMGAEVIKIEARNRPDPLRNIINRYDDLPKPFPYGLFDGLCRDKIGATVNARHPEGLKLVKDLIAVSDIVAENFRGGVLERWGLTFEEMRSVRPDIVYASISGYGQTGRYKNYAAHFHIAQAIPGFTHLTGYEGDIPVATGSWGDTTSGLQAATGVCAALEHRTETGLGQHVDTAMITCIANIMGSAYLEYNVNGREPRPGGNRLPHPVASVEGAFRCQGEERWVAIGVYTEEEWQALCEAQDRQDLLEDPRFAMASDRVCHWQELEREVEAWTRERAAEEAMAALQEAGIGAAVIQNVEDLMERDEQLAYRGYYVDTWHPDRSVGTLRIDGIVPKFSDTPGEIRRAGPTIGEHNEYVFGEILGLSCKRLGDLQEDGVFF